MRPAFVSVAAWLRDEPIRGPGLTCFTKASLTYEQRVISSFIRFSRLSLPRLWGLWTVSMKALARSLRRCVSRRRREADGSYRKPYGSKANYW